MIRYFLINHMKNINQKYAIIAYITSISSSIFIEIKKIRVHIVKLNKRKPSLFKYILFI